jgi:hypothetical protein
MNSFTKTASAVALAVGLAAPFAAEAGGEHYPDGAYRARHGDHHHHHGRDGSAQAGKLVGRVTGALLGVHPYYGYYHRPAPVFVAPPIVYREPVYVPTPAVVYREPPRLNICDEYNRCGPAYREVIIEGMRCRANDFAAQCPNGQRFALDAN